MQDCFVVLALMAIKSQISVNFQTRQCSLLETNRVCPTEEVTQQSSRKIHRAKTKQSPVKYPTRSWAGKCSRTNYFWWAWEHVFSDCSRDIRSPQDSTRDHLGMIAHLGGWRSYSSLVRRPRTSNLAAFIRFVWMWYAFRTRTEGGRNTSQSRLPFH